MNVSIMCDIYKMRTAAACQRSLSLCSVHDNAFPLCTVLHIYFVEEAICI